MKQFRSGVLVGVLTFGAIVGLWQDIIGRDAYVEFARTYWRDWHFTMPLEIAMLLVVVHTIFQVVRREL